MRKSAFLSILVIIFTFLGCSQVLVDPLTSQMLNEQFGIDYDTSMLPINGLSATGLFGIYELEISSDLSDAYLTSIRSAMLGESYIVSGLAFFMMNPCADCLKLNSIGLYDENGLTGVRLGMSVKHPFPKGNTSLPPSATNRLDLDVFDLALVVYPDETTPMSFPLTMANAYSDIMVNADGYTRDLKAITKDEAALPYKICYEKSNNNRFEMGTNYQPFDIILLPGPPPGLRFTLFLTMGYGASAKKIQRLSPTYYVPEFNRKSAWKVNVTPPESGSTWIAGDTTTLHDVVIDIYDWNHGATVAGTYPDPTHPNYISSKSDINSVTVEVPGMTNAIVNAGTSDTTTNGWDDPITYIASFANENNLPAGTYDGLVKVTDSRIPPTSDAMDFGYGWAQNWNDNEYPTDLDMRVHLDVNGNCIVPGAFKGTVDFDPGPGFDWRTSDTTSATDGYVKKFNSDGNYLWARTWGSVDMTVAYDVVTNTLGEIYVIGRGASGAYIIKLDPNGNQLWLKTWNTSYIGVTQKDIAIDASGNIYITGGFYGSGDFDPGSGVVNRSSFGDEDAFLSCFDPDGNFLSVRTWGGFGIDRAIGVSVTNLGNIYTTGTFTDMADMDPGSGDFILDSFNQYPAPFLSKLDSSGVFQWALTWGSQNGDSTPTAIVSDDSENTYLTGFYEGVVDFDPGPSTFLSSSSYSTFDCFVLSFDPSGNFRWMKTRGASKNDAGKDIAYDPYGFVLVTGFFGETGYPTAFLEKFDLAGNAPWRQMWTGIPSGISMDDFGNVCVTGKFDGSVDFNLGPGKDIHNAAGGENRFVVKYLTRDVAFEGASNTLVHTPDGSRLQWRYVPEYATYQMFKALVE